jgi:hypothetical protein
MMGLKRGVCLLCQKCTLFYLVLKLVQKFSLYSVLNKNSNITISKLWGFYHTQLCDLLRGIEVI